MSFTVAGTPIGSPQGPQDAAMQREQSATKLMAQQQTMLVKDTLEVPLSKLQGTDDTHRYYYQSSQNKPLMPMYVQVFLNREEKQPPTWPQCFKELESKLPEELKAFLKETDDPPLKKSLEFAAKGLDWLRDCKGVNIKINDEERKKIEQMQTEESLDFYREVLQACNAVAKRLPPMKRERDFLYHMGMKIPIIISSIGAKRKKVEQKRTFSRGDEVILKEIDELKLYMDKNLGERRPILAGFLIEQLEVIHQLSYPALNKRFYRILSLHDKLREMDFSSINRLLGPFQFLSDRIAELGAKEPFCKEASVYIAEMLLLFIYLFDRNEKKKDFTFFLQLTFMMASGFLQELGKEMMQGLLIDERSADWIYKSVLGVAASMLFTLMKIKKLHEKESEELFEMFKPTLIKALSANEAYLEDREGLDELKAVSKKLNLALEQENQEVFVEETVKALASVGINQMDLEKTLRGLDELNKIIQENLLGSEKERNKLAYTARSA